MAAGNWNEILESYRFPQKEYWGKDFIWMEKLINQILANRDLSILYPVTSHHRLIMYIGKSFEGIDVRPQIKIELSYEAREELRDKFRFKLSLVTGREDEDVFKEYVESIYCSLEKSLEVFDELFDNLKAITANNSQIGTS